MLRRIWQRLAGVALLSSEVRSLRAYRTGIDAFQAGDHAAAERGFRTALSHRTDLAEAHFYLGVIARRRGHCDEAADALRRAIAHKPQLVPAWLELGILAMEGGDDPEAERCLSQAMALQPDSAAVCNARGTLHMRQEQFADAARCFKRAIRIDPGSAHAHSNLAYVTLYETFDDEAALAYATRATTLDPTLPEGWGNLAMVLQYQGRCEQALVAAERAGTLGLVGAKARMTRAYALLMLGRFAEGWPEHEARLGLLPTFSIRRFPYPDWDGAPLAGRRLLVYSEQGLGDEIMFASCLPDLLWREREVVIECSVKLASLYRRSFPVATVLVADQSLPELDYLQAVPAIDCKLAAGSLPLHFRTSREAFPSHTGYLVPDAGRVRHWRERLAALGPGLKIGLSWRGGAKHTNQARRSLALHELEPLLRVAATHFVSLQYTECAEEIAGFEREQGLTLSHWQPSIDDYDETAALVAALDLVITVQTAVLHLAGALGRPVWVLMPETPEWRYMAAGDTLPWYPSARLFRRDRATSWATVIERVARELAQRAAA